MHDCIVVGGGLIGMFTARELAANGLRVLLLDRQACGQEASWSGGGILSPLYPWRYPEPVTRLAAWSQAHYQDLTAEILQESDIDPEWSCSGMLCVGIEDELQAENWARTYGYELHGLMQNELQQHEPSLQQNFTRALYLPDIAQIRNPRLVKGVRQSLLTRKVEIKEFTSVERLLVNAGRVKGVDTDCGEFQADKVVICGGAWTGELVRDMNLDLAVEPVRGQMLMFRTQPGLIRHIVLGSDFYLIPRRDGRLLAGSTLEYVGYDHMPTEQAGNMLQSKATELVPQLADCEIEMQWTGLRPGTKNEGIPYVSDISSVSGLYVNSGHFRNGVVLAPASARLMADIVLQRETIVDPASYQVRERES